MPSATEDSQKREVLRAFTTQADAYAQSPVMTAAELRRSFVDSIPVSATTCALDVATGPGFLAQLLAQRSGEVIGVDATPAMLQRAREQASAQGLGNVRFEQGDAEALAFDDATFDVVTCGFAFHHFVEPRRVLAEMVRVVRPGGWVGVLEIIASEDAQQAALHNQLERLRDPSHTRALPLSELKTLFDEAGLAVHSTASFPVRRTLDEWLAITHPSVDLAGRIREQLLASMERDSTGLNARFEGEALCFDHTFAWIIGARPTLHSSSG